MKVKTQITVETTVDTSIEKAWEYWTEPKHITKWNFASDDWICPVAENDLRVGGRFLYRMEASDKSVAFDFAGEYLTVEEFTRIEYRIDDDRMVWVEFSVVDGQTRILETFEAENLHPAEMQAAGWQAILNNYKKHAESF